MNVTGPLPARPLLWTDRDSLRQSVRAKAIAGLVGGVLYSVYRNPPK